MKYLFCLLVFCTLLSEVRSQYWEPLGGGIKGYSSVHALATDTFHDLLFVGGYFDSTATIEAHNLVAWDGHNWIRLPFEPENIADLVMKNDTLIYLTELNYEYQVGMFVDTTFVGNLDQLGGAGSCLYLFNNTLYAGGEFEGGIKYWEDNQWKIPGGGVNDPFMEVQAIGSYQGQLIVGGHFSTAGTLPANSIAMWDGFAWHALGDGVLSDGAFEVVATVQEYDGILYVGGSFDEAGGIFTGGFAKWDGENWDTVALALGEYSCGSPYAMFVRDSTLYVTGTISGQNNSCLGQRAAMFDGIEWYNMNLSAGGSGNAITVFESDLIVGTNFKYIVGYDTVNFIGRFLGFPTSSQTLNESEIASSVVIFPNPSSTTIQFRLLSTPTTLTLFNLLGEKVKEEKVIGGEVVIYVSELPAGVYLASTSEGVIGKFVKE